MKARFYDNLSQDFSQLLEDADDYNVKIKVGENSKTQEFRAHSVILRARSPYFKKALSDSWVTIKDGSIVFNKPNISPAVFTLILKYIYSGNLDLNKISNTDVLDLLVASDELLLRELLDHIQDYLIKQASSWLKSNLITTLHTVFQLSCCKKLVDYCLDSICNNPKPFFSSENFSSLKKSIFLELIKRDELKIEEVDIWEHLIKWGIFQTSGIREMKPSDVKKFLEKDFKNLKGTLDPFIPYIRFHEISSKDFYNKVRPFRKILPESLFEDVMSFLMAGTEPKQRKLLARVGFFIDGSKFFTRNHADVISSWIKRKDTGISKENRSQFTLLYRGTRDGLNVNSFRQKVNNQGPAIAVVKIKDSETIIGGFNATGWSNNNQYYNSYSNSYSYNHNNYWNNNGNHFIFSFKGIRDKIGIIGRSTGSSGVYDYNNMLYFGSSDLLLHDGINGTCNQNSYDKRILDTNNFIAEELEVFKVVN
ncbi:9229_t:CDS:2 [Acaulospora morrowiae]|uniref:9229_t:CDS:1 n=1 Tax=Acaulospora morrowiae TaxID=94023 RepID=A0A9N8ZHQ4_9GLOM|nr:9229_t:CDS:2 [Acaulospora morrowiae]